MQITPEAKIIFEKVLADRGMDCIKLGIIRENGREIIDLQIGNSTDGDNIVEIDGIKIMASEENLIALESVIFTGDDGKIGILQTGGCAGCSGCDDGESDGCDCGCEHS